MATINGQFDMAMLLLERGADPNLAAKVNGATPLWAAINTQWQPRTRFPQPQEMELQKATYLDVMSKLLEKGADPNARLYQHPWYMVYSGCGNRNCGLADTAGLDRLLARRLFHRRRGDAPAGQVRRRPQHPDDGAAAAGPPRPRRAAAPASDGVSKPLITPPPVLAADSLRRPGRHGAPRRGRRRVRRGLRRQRPSPRARQLAAGGEVPGRGDGRRRQRPRQRRLHRRCTTPRPAATTR